MTIEHGPTQTNTRTGDNRQALVATSGSRRENIVTSGAGRGKWWK